MKKQLYLIITVVLFISVILLSISYAKESTYEQKTSTYEINEENIKIIYGKNNYFTLNKNFSNDITIVNKDSKEIAYGLFLKEVNNREYSNIYYSINGEKNKKIIKNLLYIGTLSKFGTQGDLNTLNVKLSADKDFSSSNEFVLEIRIIDNESLSELITIDKSTYLDSNSNYRYYGEIVNNYLIYENQLYRIIGLIDNKIKIINEPVIQDKFNSTSTHLTIDDYIASFNNIMVNNENILNYKSWLTLENYYLVDRENNPFVIDKNKGLIAFNSSSKYYIRNIVELNLNTKIIKGNGTEQNPYEVSYEN